MTSCDATVTSFHCFSSPVFKIVFSPLKSLDINRLILARVAKNSGRINSAKDLQIAQVTQNLYINIILHLCKFT